MDMTTEPRFPFTARFLLREQQPHPHTTTMSGKVIVYGDLMSQPSRAAYWLGLLAQVPNFEFKLVQIIKQQHMTPEFAKVYVLARRIVVFVLWHFFRTVFSLGGPLI
jgi:hypothetical protein